MWYHLHWIPSFFLFFSQKANTDWVTATSNWITGYRLYDRWFTPLLLTVCFTETDDYSIFHLSTPIFPEEKGDRSLLTQVPALETISADCSAKFRTHNGHFPQTLHPSNGVRVLPGGEKNNYWNALNCFLDFKLHNSLSQFYFLMG